MIRHLLIATALLFPLSAIAADSPPGIKVTEVMNTTTTMTGQPLEVPAKPKLLVWHYDIQPGAKLPVHKHPHQRYAYIIEGELDGMNVDTGKAFHYKAGEFVAEMRDTWHFGENKSGKTVRLLVIDQIPPTAENNIIRQEIGGGK